MKTAILVTQHYLSSKRKAGFHWLANSYWKAGWNVVFLTCYVSPTSFLRGERRFPRHVLKQVLLEARRMHMVQERLYSYVWLTPWHPANLRIPMLNRLTHGFFARYGSLRLGPIESSVREADLFVFEPTPGLLLFPRFRRLNPTARYVYRVSDDLRLLNRHPVVLEAEERYASQFDLVSAPSEYIYHRFREHVNSALHYHGVETRLFDAPTRSPYDNSTVNFVFVGNSRFDIDFLSRASRLFPSWLFHIIGPIHDIPKETNIRIYGEMPYRETVPYIKHADVGLHTLVYSPGAESFTDSLKVLQYTYCRLPVVAPAFLRTERSNSFYYRPGDDDSIRACLLDAVAYRRELTDTASIGPWETLASALAGPLWDAVV